AGVKSRLPVPIRLRVEGSMKWPSVNYDQMQIDAQQHLSLDNVYASDQQLHTNSDSALQHSTSPSSSSAGSDRGSEPRIPGGHTHSESALLSQLELLNQECQEKEALINKMSEQLADLEDLHAQLQEKERLNNQYDVALQAANSTIAYLTACSLDNQSNFGSHKISGSVGPDVDLHSRCMELQNALQEKEKLNNQLIELLNMAEKAITSSHSQDEKPETDDLCSRIEGALHQVHAHSNRDSLNQDSGHTEDSVLELQQHADSLQKALLEQSKLNAELQEQLRAAHAAAQRGCLSEATHLNGPKWRKRAATAECLIDNELDSLVKSQARELSQLRQQIKESRRLGALQRRQLEELNKAFKDLLHAGEVDCYMGEEKNRLIQSLQSQIQGQTPSSHHSSHSDLSRSDVTTSSCQSSANTQGGSRAHGQQHSADNTGAAVSPAGGAQEKGAPPHRRTASTVQGLQREIRRLQEQLRSNEELNATLRSELDLHRSIIAQTSFSHQEQDPGQDQEVSGPQTGAQKQGGDISSQEDTGGQPRIMNSDKQKENEKLRETLARRTAKLEQSRKECEALRQENIQLQETLEHSSQENSLLQNSLRSSREELQRLQCEVKLQRQQLSDSQHLLQSLRVELQVYENIKNDSNKHGSHEETPQSVPVSSCGSVNLGDLLSEIRHLRLQLERSIQTNTALRQKLEEQLLRGPSRSETININYLLSSPGIHRALHEHTSVYHEEDAVSVSSSSNESVSGAPSRLVPGHRMWASRNGRHILGLIEDYNALRKQISEGRKLSRSMDAQLQECLHTLRQQGSDSEVLTAPPC
ncbi:hypothetical protein GOODEAATRI_016071, partial [Goodea atripinnis]